MKWLPGLFLVAVLPLRSFAESAPLVSVPQHQEGFLVANCFECHDSLTEEGGVNLEDLSLEINSLESAATWQNILDTVNRKEMPPPDHEQPDEMEKGDFLRELSRTMVAARKSLSDRGGEITMRRLNRREYIRTMRDLLGVSVDPSLLPADEVTRGFDTFGASLFLSPDQIEMYHSIATDAVAKMMNSSGKQTEPKKQTVHFEEGVNRNVRNTYRNVAEGYGKVLAWEKQGKPNPREVGLIDTGDVKVKRDQFHFIGLACTNYMTLDHTETGVWLTEFEPKASHCLSVNLPSRNDTDRYRVRVRIGAKKDARESRKFLQIATTPRQDFVPIDAFKIEGTIEKPQILEFELTFEEGQKRMVSIRERGPTSQELSASQRSNLFGGNLLPEPTLWVDYIEWEGPLPDSELITKRNLLIPQRKEGGEQDRDLAKRTIQNFAQHAFRERSISPAFLDRLVEVFDEERKVTGSFREAIVAPLAIALSSPSFLFLAETAPSEGNSRKIDEEELASRLSYFLWSTQPDEALRAKARSGELAKPAIVEAQVERLLESANRRALVEGFAHQWLDMKRLDFFQFSAERFPGYDESVREAAREELYAMVEASLEGALPLGRLLKSDKVYVNDLLADYYGIDGVEGGHFRPVQVPKGQSRGGLATTAAVLMMGSDGEQTSPVERGAWILRHLLNDAPPPAPPNVPQLEHDTDEPITARQLLMQHTKEAQCAQCHRSIDPLGFAFEQFDATGRWREMEEAMGRKVNKQGKRVGFRKQLPIDTSGEFIDGTKFKGAVGVKDLLFDRREQFIKGAAEHLIAYALGRRTTFSDEQMIVDILTKCPPEPTLRDLAVQITLHPTFREKRVEELASAE